MDQLAAVDAGDFRPLASGFDPPLDQHQDQDGEPEDGDRDQREDDQGHRAERPPEVADPAKELLEAEVIVLVGIDQRKRG